MIEAVRRCGRTSRPALLTNNFVTPVWPSRDSALADVLALFDAVVESSVVGVRKPDERFYLLACEMLDIAPGRGRVPRRSGREPEAGPGARHGAPSRSPTPRARSTSWSDVVGIPLR